MCDKQEYKLQISNRLVGQKLEFSDFPQLNVIYLAADNNLCPSNYSDAICVWEGDLHVTLRVNGKIITLNDHDVQPSKIDDYNFQGVKALVENRSRDQTYLILSIQKCNSEQTYNLGQPFIVEVPDNPTTGYTWTIETTPGLQIVSDTYSKRCKPGIVGCGGVRTFVLKVTQRGKQIFTGIHEQSWDPSTMVTSRYEFNIV